MKSRKYYEQNHNNHLLRNKIKSTPWYYMMDFIQRDYNKKVDYIKYKPFLSLTEDRLVDTIVKVGTESDIALQTTCGSPITSAGPGATVNVQCDPPICGRYVTIVAGLGVNQGVLTMCEVYMFTGVCDYECSGRNQRT